MEQLRTPWIAEDAETQGPPSEAVPESATTDRFRPEGTATGEDHRAGVEEQTATAGEAVGERPSMPPDPPPVENPIEKSGATS